MPPYAYNSSDPLAVGLLHLENSDSAVLAAVKGKLTSLGQSTM